MFGLWLALALFALAAGSLGLGLRLRSRVLVVINVEGLHCDSGVRLVGIKGMFAWMSIAFFLIFYILLIIIIFFEVIGVFSAHRICRNVISM